jgi:hypothetical protein
MCCWLLILLRSDVDVRRAAIRVAEVAGMADRLFLGALLRPFERSHKLFCLQTPDVDSFFISQTLRSMVALKLPIVGPLLSIARFGRSRRCQAAPDCAAAACEVKLCMSGPTRT